MDGHLLESIHSRPAILVNVDTDGISGFESKCLESLDHLFVSVHMPVDACSAISNRIDTVGIVAAEIETDLLLCNQCIGF